MDRMNRVAEYHKVIKYIQEKGGSVRDALKACGHESRDPQWFYDVRSRIKKSERKNGSEEDSTLKKTRKKNTPTLVEVSLPSPPPKKKDITILIGDSDEIMKVLERARTR